MPKKGGKGKGDGKKGSKAAKNAKKDLSVQSMSEANSKLWETRLTLSEQSKQEYRDTARKLLVENEVIHRQMHQTERDTIDVISYLKQQDQEKDHQVEELQEIIIQLKKEHREESERVVDEFQQQMAELEQNLEQKTTDIAAMHEELKQVKEFRRKRAQMQEELEEIRENMFATNKEHKETLQRMDQKFFEEKMRLQEEADKRVAELAERAHAEAIANLDETTKSVYKENVRLTESLSYHVEESNKLKRAREKLLKENEQHRGDKELNELLIQEKVQQHRNNKLLIKEMQEKIDTLEKSLSHMVEEFEIERENLVARSQKENESAVNEVKKLQRILELRNREANKIKKLAKNILDQRTEMERFFLDALEHVKLEIAANRSQYRRDAQAAYQRRMLAAHAGQSDYPKIRTFNKSDNSTNSVFRDLEAAERLIDISGRVEISDLTWEQKERVLRYLFAKLNGARDKRVKLLNISQGDGVVPSIREKQAWGDANENPRVDDKTFLTQAAVEEDGTIERLPQITGPNTTSQPEPPIVAQT